MTALDPSGLPPDAARRLIEADIEFTRGTWSAPSFDIWEEEIGHHYYTRLVQFAALADGAEWLDTAVGGYEIRHGRVERAPGVHAVSEAVDQEVARLKLATLGIEIDVLSAAQERYLRPFR